MTVTLEPGAAAPQAASPAQEPQPPRRPEYPPVKLPPTELPALPEVLQLTPPGTGLILTHAKVGRTRDQQSSATAFINEGVGNILETEG